MVVMSPSPKGAPSVLEKARELLSDAIPSEFPRGFIPGALGVGAEPQFCRENQLELPKFSLEGRRIPGKHSWMLPDLELLSGTGNSSLELGIPLWDWEFLIRSWEFLPGTGSCSLGLGIPQQDWEFFIGTGNSSWGLGIPPWD